MVEVGGWGGGGGLSHHITVVRTICTYVLILTQYLSTVATFMLCGILYSCIKLITSNGCIVIDYFMIGILLLTN